MSWDDEDFDIPTKTAATGSWEDGVEDDDPILDSWDVDEEEEDRKKKEAEAKKKADLALKKKPQTKPQPKGKKGTTPKVVLDIDKVDAKTRLEMLRKAELSSDLKNASDLFGELSVDDEEAFDVNEHPRERAAKAAAAKTAKAAANITKDTPLDIHPIFRPETKQEYEKLRKTLSTTLTKLADESAMYYASSLAIDLIRDLTKPLSVENTRKVTSTLNVVMKEKERADRQERLKKSGGTASGGAGKKKVKSAVNPNNGASSFKKDTFDDMDNMDFADDDFM